jgi:uncharacterized membrane protein YfhO
MDTDEALGQIAAGAIDPLRTVVLEDPPPLRGEVPAEPDQVQIAHYSPETVCVEVETVAPGMLVLSDIMYPAWHARVDDAPAEIYVANGALRAVAVPAGRHTIEFQYASAAMPVGAAITGITLLVLLCVAVRPKRTW